LLAMCGNWNLYNDGYPDIMVLANNELRFEEIKAQGDTLRRNQLMQLQSLRSVNIDVGITTVDWTLDPMQPYAVIDIETTGGRAGSHKITEIGMIKMVNGEVVDQWQSLINPQRRIPSMITSLTGITNDMVADAPLFTDIADEVERFTENCIFVAHNVNFDYGFIREEFARLNRMYKRPKLCTVQQMRKHFKGLKSYSLANLTKHFEIGMERHHRALSDAVAAGELLKMVNKARVAEALTSA
jgi:DNA polymerase-3 subunit epsilon